MIRGVQVEREQQTLAIMQMVVVLIFVLCNCLAMVSNILEAFKFEAVPLTQVSNLLVTTNSSVNIFVYCAFGKRFRSELKKLLKKMFCCLPTCNICPKILVWRPSPEKSNNQSTVCYPNRSINIRIQMNVECRNGATDV